MKQWSEEGEISGGLNGSFPEMGYSYQKCLSSPVYLLSEVWQTMTLLKYLE